MFIFMEWNTTENWLEQPIGWWPKDAITRDAHFNESYTYNFPVSVQYDFKILSDTKIINIMKENIIMYYIFQVEDGIFFQVSFYSRLDCWFHSIRMNNFEEFNPCIWVKNPGEKSQNNCL